MDLQTLSSLDDLLSDVLLDGVHLWFQTHKMSKDYQPLCLPQEAILRIIQKRVIIDRRVPDAVKELLEHARRYLNVYLPSAGFEISQTDRYSALTNKSEACVIATRVFEAGHELRFCAGSIANLTIQEERDLEKKTSDFSVIRTSRRGTCLFLGPARFVNHDCDPNCNFMPVGADVICFKALKSIDINEEITTYYGDNYFGVGNQECLCATCESTKPSAKYNSIAPVESDTVSNAIQPRHVQHAGAFVHRLLSPNSTHEYEGSSSWLQIGSGELALGYGDASESCRANSPVPMELSSHQLHSLHDDGANSQHVPQSPVCEDADVSLAARTSLALGFHVLPDSVSDLSLVMDSATDTSGSSLSTPPYTESNSDVDIDGDEKGGDKSNRGNANLLQSVRSRMSIAFLCHDSSPSPSPSPGLITRKQSSPHISTCSVNALEDRGRTSMSTIDFHKLESTNGVAKPIEPSPGSMDEPIENKQCPTCKNNFRKQERSPTADCERCHRHLSIYGVRWPSRSNGVLKEKMAKLDQECRKSKEAQGSSFEGASSSTAPSHGFDEEGTVYRTTKCSRIEGDINGEASSRTSIQHS
ncbi:Histone-lysine N-methyltransferase set9 [Podila minutissima]|nr:Histone-lysine N-methyltransferase set9 [Podila minutissima]